ncbi:Uncharacterized protein C22orf9 like protein [Gryllus bimaculatus]|nr:Uncharacterized protein C22orf9 like protein [Gryllus bimaculatus]
MASAAASVAALLLVAAAQAIMLRPAAAAAATISSISSSSNGSNLEFKEGPEQYVFEPLLSSSWARDRKFLRQLQEALCRPRPILVSVTPPNAEDGAKFSPDRVEVVRCAGACGASRKACVATAVATARVPVVLLTPGRNTTAGHVLVQRHEACACACATQPQDCSERQAYIAAECRCGCHPRLHAEERRCNAQKHFAWDDETCRCGCQRPAASCQQGHMSPISSTRLGKF